mmetsp:Transcript_6322/g.18780  ORF Transcript_6322/g.18780 Transcript_6322/m.18780 type:complete len:318 (+) Transcript_6322:615-1568(+)
MDKISRSRTLIAPDAHQTGQAWRVPRVALARLRPRGAVAVSLLLLWRERGEPQHEVVVLTVLQALQELGMAPAAVAIPAGLVLQPWVKHGTAKAIGGTPVRSRLVHATSSRRSHRSNTSISTVAQPWRWRGIAERRQEEVRHPCLRQCLRRKGRAVVRIVCGRLSAFCASVEECTEALTRAGLRPEVSADDGPEVLRVVELFLRPVRERAPESQWASLGILSAGVLLGPVGAGPRAIAYGHLPPRVLVIVRVDAGLPVVLNPDRAPERLESVHEELLCQRTGCLLLLLERQERRASLLSGVCEGAGRTAPALGDVRE